MGVGCRLLHSFEMSHIFVHMKTTTVRQVRNDFGSVLRWVAGGEEVLVTRRRQPVATIVPPRPARRTAVRRPDFAARLLATYGDRMVDQAMIDKVLADNRGPS